MRIGFGVEGVRASKFGIVANKTAMHNAYLEQAERNEYTWGFP